ncbi:2-nitropropane dioxygenase [Sphingomonas sp. Leaf339]|uniref:NAD(P)H-dependent flavin oxidoreductase n=1 Tax=Sphingomonas sp. Leaf339 TaxID=1736343 RepID=UPI0006F3496A|nr:nitronate monooxygenase [Sphingomonas sp. Leaf339]KQU45970.1 2-nitropropane dioxygenase [Sphingomonas sp. Leaf339]
MTLLQQLGMAVPIIQAPMAGVSTPKLAAAISNAGGLGSIGIGAVDATAARSMIDATRALTERAFNVNLFVHATAKPDAANETRWLEALRPLFQRFGSTPPDTLKTIYTSFADDDDMLAMLVEAAPPVISFHFGVPSSDRINALKNVGCLLLASATSPDEARSIEAAGIDVVVAQGWEAGGHRGVFDPSGLDDQLGMAALTRLLVRQASIPVVAAGGIMDGQGIRATLNLGAIAAQLGTAFIACPESGADEAYRAALSATGASHTIMTHAISGRPARCIANRFTEWGASAKVAVPAYPIAYDAGKALNTAAKAKGENGFGAQWAGQGAPLHRAMPAADLLGLLWREATTG